MQRLGSLDFVHLYLINSFHFWQNLLSVVGRIAETPVLNAGQMQKVDKIVKKALEIESDISRIVELFLLIFS